MVDWFERLTGFRETDYEGTRARLAVEGGRLRSKVNGRSYAIGTLELVSLAELRRRAAREGAAGSTSFTVARGDVRDLHRAPANEGALFQVASQFNLLEMVGPSVRPEDGVTRYASDRTQGPACAIAAGAATIYRNYFAPVGDGFGQGGGRQLDGLADLGHALAMRLGTEVGRLWTMRNGYALAKPDELRAVARLLAELSEAERDELRGLLRVGLHRDVAVTEGAEGDPRPPLVSQVFCSALPVAYGEGPAEAWAPFARLVLEAAYEATLRAGRFLAAGGGSNRVLLTWLGGGAFGNDPAWIADAVSRALALSRSSGLEVELVSFGQPSTAMLGISRPWHEGARG